MNHNLLSRFMIHKTRNFRLSARGPPGVTIGEGCVVKIDVVSVGRVNSEYMKPGRGPGDAGRGGSRWNVVGEGPDGVRFEEPMELLTRKEGRGGSVRVWLDWNRKLRGLCES